MNNIILGGSMKKESYIYEQIKLFITVVLVTVLATVMGLLLLHQLRRWALMSSSQQAVVQTQNDIQVLQKSGCLECGDTLQRLQGRLDRKQNQLRLLAHKWFIPSKKTDLDRFNNQLLFQLNLNKKMYTNYIRTLREFGNIGLHVSQHPVRFAQYQAVILSQEQQDLIQQLALVQAARNGEIMKVYAVIEGYQEMVDYYKNKIQKYMARGMDPHETKFMRCRAGLCQVVKERDILEKILDY
jgi:hypothetical protein